MIDLLIWALSRVQARLEEVPKDDGAALGQQVLRAANSTAQVRAHHLQQDAPQVALVLIVYQAVMEDTQAFMQPQAHQGLLAVALLGAGHHHTLQVTVTVQSEHTLGFCCLCGHKFCQAACLWTLSIYNSFGWMPR